MLVQSSVCYLRSKANTVSKMVVFLMDVLVQKRVVQQVMAPVEQGIVQQEHGSHLNRSRQKRRKLARVMHSSSLEDVVADVQYTPL